MSNSVPVELETVSLDHAVEMGEAYKRLQRNGDFKKIITEGYLKAKVLASVSLLAVPQMKEAGQRPGTMEDIISASNLMYFLLQIERQYAAATTPILSDEEEAELAALEAQEAIDQIDVNGKVN
jgi:hypothetical protein